MTLEEGKTLLQKENIPFQEVDYPNEADFFRYVSLFPYLSNAKSCRVKALVIKSRHGIKNIALQFNQTEAAFCFADLYFGGYTPEFFRLTHRELLEELPDALRKIMRGEIGVIMADDLSRKKQCWDGAFDLSSDDFLGYDDFWTAVKSIETEKKSIRAKLLKRKMRYEIFDFNSYRCIDK